MARKKSTGTTRARHQVRRAAPSRSRSAKPTATPNVAPPPFVIPADATELRTKLAQLSEEEQRALEARLGPVAVERMRHTARRSRAGARIGRVIVLHGIMGSNLDSRDDDGDWDRVWVHVRRLIGGRLADLELDAEGNVQPTKPDVRVTGQFPEYLPLVVELGKHFDVHAFAFDWRMDIDKSADQLARVVQEFGRGMPVHLVAHSMGGLVARRFAFRHRELWQSMDDPNGRRAGGRLVQLGTPNRGSFAIPLFLTGEEGILKKLALIDLHHDKREVVKLLRGFAGSYQMLPTPDARYGDDRARLYEAATWGEWPVVQALIDRARAFHDDLRVVQDPERLIYVAGDRQETPYRIAVEKQGVFKYKRTLQGDGRVPHELGLLDDVRTFFVEEAHGDLPKNRHVLDVIDELLIEGTTQSLARQAADTQERSTAREATRSSTAWLSAGQVDVVEPELRELISPARRGTNAVVRASDEGRVEALLARSALGSGPQRRADVEEEVRQVAALAPTAKRDVATLPKLAVDVVHGDITLYKADAYAVGHYAGVMPQYAERALDAVISARNMPPEDCVLATLTRSGHLTGELGSTSLFPWRGAKSKRLVAVAGMGRPGTFGRGSLRKLAHGLARTLMTLPDVEHVATVLIGGGAGNLSTIDAVRGILWGAADALKGASTSTGIKRLTFVERDAARAAEILAALDNMMPKETRKELEPDEAHDSLGDELRITLTRGLRVGAGASTATRATPGAKSATARATVAAHGMPSRYMWTRDDKVMRVSALTSSAVIPERVIAVDLSLIDELVVRMTDPEADAAAHDGALLARLLLPHDFRDHMRGTDGGTRIFEVDRFSAGIHWEMLSVTSQPEELGTPVGLCGPLARQLRTTYAPAPQTDDSRDRPLRVLVIGDPGDPAHGHDLPGARAEALEVIKLFEELSRQRIDAGQPPIEIVTLIGAPSVARSGSLARHRPASRLDALDHLTRGGWDILHYSGHGDFDPADPRRAGWVFGGGLLTSNELARMETAPKLVVANACLSARTSNRLTGGKHSSSDPTRVDLLPSLADEFFHRGARNYVGTAWEVDDQGAVEFARCFYSRLLGLEGPRSKAGKLRSNAPASIGEALWEARELLHQKRTRYDALWAAYQHYGDPHERLRVPSGAGRSKR